MARTIPFNDYFIQNGKYGSEFEEVKKLEEGTYGELFKVRNKTTKEISSIKKIHLTPDNEKKLKKELEVLSIIKNLGGERVVHYFSAWLENNPTDENRTKTLNESYTLYIQLQFCDKTLSDMMKEIHRYLYSNETKTLKLIGFYIASQLFTEILKGVDHLHKSVPPIIHRNLNPNNIKVVNDIRGNSVKIGHFDSAAIHQYSDQSHTRLIGHPTYIAPEVERGRKYDTKADIYSLGIIFQELFSIDINREYTGNGSPLLMKKYKNISNLLERMMRIRYKERPDCEEILKDKSSWTLSADEFGLKEEFKYIVEHNINFKESFVYQLIIYKWIEWTLQSKENYLRKDWYGTKFIEGQLLGKGSYGKVFKVTEKANNKVHAIKIIEIKDNYEYDFIHELETSHTITKLDHERLVKYYDVWLEETFTEMGSKTPLLYIQMESCNEKTLKDVIEEIKKYPYLREKYTLTPLVYSLTIQLFIETLEGVNYLHTRDEPFIHRDLKPDNILLKTRSKDGFVKIGDFGLTCIHKYATQTHTTDRGHIDYAAPEVRLSKIYNTKSDIYSLGLIFQQLIIVDTNRDYMNSENISPPLKPKYQALSDLLFKMKIERYKERSDCQQILIEKNLWPLNANEFDFRKELDKVPSSYQTNDLFVYKLLKQLLINK